MRYLILENFAALKNTNHLFRVDVFELFAGNNFAISNFFLHQVKDLGFRR